MKITLLVVGKTQTLYIKEGVAEYMERLTHFADVALVEVSDIKHGSTLTPRERSEREGTLLLERYLTPKHFVALLDEQGKEFSSQEFAQWIDKRLQSGQDVALVVAGPYGASDALKARADTTISLSRMTFSHEMVRLFATEQLYRAFTILRGLPYHHE
jgi:23S rRNA (pseudouridine1915-N3)-methyltransferase